MGGEINAVRPDKPCRASFALCFPDLYEVGTAHFGQQILYHLLNQMDGILAERVFAPALDMARQLKATGLPLFSLETKRPLGDFDVVGFSLLYELNYTNVLLMMDLSGIPFYATQRDESYPLVIAGGPCMFNPEPVADFFDAIVVGDGEEAVVEMAEAMISLQREGGKPDKKELLKRWSTIKGVYIPQLYDARYDDNGLQHLVPKEGAPERVERAVLSCLRSVDFPDEPVLPFGKPIHDRLRLEIARGCSRGCRFCQAGMIYRPVRERSVEAVLALAEAALKATGYEDLSLLSLSTGDYSGLNCLMEQLVNRYGGKNISISVPSFRAGSLNPGAMKLIQSVRKTGFTIAPEAGSQRLRDVINKNVTEEEITKTIQDAFGLGWNLVKLYFMIGLPTETEQDVEEMISLVRRLSRLGGRPGRKENLHVSVATFVPKAHTPFQWERQIPIEKAKETLFFLNKKLNGRQIGFKWQNPEVSFLEGVFARGDRRLSKLIKAAYDKGCRFDGWTDCFAFKNWMAAAEEAAINLDFYTRRVRDVGEPLPWDLVSSGISREFLIKERSRAYNQERTPDCRDGICNQCGICDFAAIAPRLNRPGKDSLEGGSFFQTDSKKPETRRKMELVYSKTGPARFFGHLELMNILIRAMNRAGIPVVYSQGFHPMPRIAFPEPLPVGLESEGETLVMTVTDDAGPMEHLQAELNRQLPEGIRIKACRLISDAGRKPGSEKKKILYGMDCTKAVFDNEKATLFSLSGRVLLEKKNKDGLIKTVDLKEIVDRLTVIDSMHAQLEVNDLPGKKARPADIIGVIFGLDEVTVKKVRIVKVLTA